MPFDFSYFDDPFLPRRRKQATKVVYVYGKAPSKKRKKKQRARMTPKTWKRNYGEYQSTAKTVGQGFGVLGGMLKSALDRRKASRVSERREEPEEKPKVVVSVTQKELGEYKKDQRDKQKFDKFRERQEKTGELKYLE